MCMCMSAMRKSSRPRRACRAVGHQTRDTRDSERGELRAEVGGPGVDTPRPGRLRSMLRSARVCGRVTCDAICRLDLPFFAPSPTFVFYSF